MTVINYEIGFRPDHPAYSKGSLLPLIYSEVSPRAGKLLTAFTLYYAVGLRVYNAISRLDSVPDNLLP